VWRAPLHSGIHAVFIFDERVPFLLLHCYSAIVARVIFDYLDCDFREEEEEEQVMQSSSQSESLIRVVFSWSIQDVLNRDLYKDRVWLCPFSLFHFSQQ
jgi:hypothetical protein